jgi:hypothetical protein
MDKVSSSSNDTTGTLMSPTPQTMVVFDFDGVLAIPWTNPEKPFEIVPTVIKKLSDSGKYFLGVASFNPRAVIAIESWGLKHHFTSMRAGANHSWSFDPFDYREEYRVMMSKYQQIISMVQEIESTKKATIKTIVFFDDDPKNIESVEMDVAEVGSDKRNWHCCLVSTHDGINSRCLKYIQRRSIRDYHKNSTSVSSSSLSSLSSSSSSDEEGGEEEKKKMTK